MADYLPRFAFPGQDPNVPVTDNSRNLVWDPRYGFPAGYVKTKISSDGLTVINQTTPWHLLYDGEIIRRAIRLPGGSWITMTHGVGNNVIPGMAHENLVQGPQIFDAVDKLMREYILRDHGRGKSLETDLLDRRFRTRHWVVGDSPLLGTR